MFFISTVLSLLVFTQARDENPTPHRLSSEGSGFNPLTHVFEHTHRPRDVMDYELEWSVIGDEIFIKITADTKGYVALGITEAGGMIGSDIVVASVDDDDGSLTVIDYYAEAESMPEVDCKQDWVGHWGQQTSTHTSVIISRKLNTGDYQDRPILNDGYPSRLLLAYSPFDLDNLHYHAQSKFAFRLQFFTEEESVPLHHQTMTFEEMKNDPSVKYFDVKSNDYAIPSWTKTTYVSFKEGFPAEDVGKDFHIVGAEHMVQPGNEAFVHHFVLYGCDTSNPSACGDQEIVWAWAPGVIPLVFPNEVGIKVGAHGYKSFSMNTHYDNPSKISNVRDTSGVRIYYSTNLRDNDAGVLQVGDGQISYAGTKVEEGISTWSFDCPSTCTQQYLDAGVEYKTLSVQLHMHQVGEAMSLKQFRDGEMIDEIVTEFYDFRFQDVSDPYHAHRMTIKAGDSFKTQCFFTVDDGEDVRFGLGSSDEMCISFITYWPKVDNLKHCGRSGTSACNGGVNTEKLTSYEPIWFRNFGKSAEEEVCTHTVYPTYDDFGGDDGASDDGASDDGASDDGASDDGTGDDELIMNDDTSSGTGAAGLPSETAMQLLAGCYDGRENLIGGCTCHSSCKACGYFSSAEAKDADNLSILNDGRHDYCLSCNDGLFFHAMFENGGTRERSGVCTSQLLLGGGSGKASTLSWLSLMVASLAILLDLSGIF